ncbi:MAG: hypothetical protein U0800_09270 [Isosphaeraceae bacterium]
MTSNPVGGASTTSPETRRLPAIGLGCIVIRLLPGSPEMTSAPVAGFSRAVTLPDNSVRSSR